MMTLKVTFECSFDRDVTVSSQPFEVKNSIPGGEELSSMKEIGNLGDTFNGIELRDSGKGFISQLINYKRVRHGDFLSEDYFLKF